MLDRFIYSGPQTRVVFGNGTIAELPAEAKRAGMNRVLILCSKGRTQLAQKIAASLGDACAGICDESVPNMPREAFDVVKAQLASSQADGFVAVGGGSPIGLAKSVAVSAQLPFIALVTTLSGSEMSPKWALGRGLGRAAGNDLRALPTVAIYDPELVLELPPRVVAASGMNAMAHAVESLYGDDTNPVIQTLSDEAIGRLYASLPCDHLPPSRYRPTGAAVVRPRSCPDPCCRAALCIGLQRTGHPGSDGADGEGDRRRQRAARAVRTEQDTRLAGKSARCRHAERPFGRGCRRRDEGEGL